MAELQRVEPLYEQFYRILKERIINNEIHPGERLIDTQLAQEFGTSRSPLREALRKLEQEGLIENNKGILTVFVPSLNDVIELYKVRSGLEYSAVFCATKESNENFIKKLEVCLSKTETALENKNYEEVIQLNTEFHDLIMYASNNKRLISMMAQIRSLILMYRKILFLDYEMDYDFFTDHALVVKYIRESNPYKAAELMVNHINNDIEYFKKVFDKSERKEI